MALRAAEDIFEWERLKGNTTNRQQTTYKVSNLDLKGLELLTTEMIHPGSSYFWPASFTKPSRKRALVHYI